MVDHYAEILETSLKVIFDLFLVFGIDAFAGEGKKTEGKKDEVSYIIWAILGLIIKCRKLSIMLVK